MTRIFARFERIEHPGRTSPIGSSGTELTDTPGTLRPRQEHHREVPGTT
jgi:hypothetical protein